jgi:glycine/D-amino acid oxidase-like deaminating enzyme
VLLERKQLACGTTWHAAGLIGQLRATQNLTRLAQYTQKLYAGLEAETGIATGLKQNGSLSVALTDERLEELRRGAACIGIMGPESRPARARHVGRSRQRGLPFRQREDHRPGHGERARALHLVCRRARLGTLRAR